MATGERTLVIALASLGSATVAVGPAERCSAAALVAVGLDYLDALHITCAQSARSDVFLTTDDRILAKSRTGKDGTMVRVADPLAWIAEVSTP